MDRQGLMPTIPDFVVLTGSTEEVSAIVKLANQYRIPVLPWGGGFRESGRNYARRRRNNP